MNIIEDKFGKILKVVLMNMEEDNRDTMGRRGSRSLCREKSRKQSTVKMKPRLAIFKNNTLNTKGAVKQREPKLQTEEPIKQINKLGKTGNTFTPKQLVIKLPKDNKNEAAPKQPFVKLSPLEKPLKVTFKVATKTENKMRTLRRLQPKNYLEESLLDSPTIEQTVKKNHGFPIYKKTWSGQQTQPKDVYEFLDISPKPKKIDRKHKSSILFDKETHEIMKKLEENETRQKKRVIRKKNKSIKQKSYEEIVNNIVSNVAQKIKKKTSPVKTISLQNPNQAINSNDFPHEVHNSSSVAADGQNPVPNTTNVVSTRTPISNTAATIFNISHIDPLLLQSIGSCDNSISQRDIDSCFGFEEVPLTSTPVKPNNENSPIKVISNVLLRPGNVAIESPIEFNTRRLNANSTGLSSPWRANWVNLRHNPHFVSTKQNALPRIEQEMVLDHTLVESFENACPRRPSHGTPPRKTLVQQNILEFVNSNIENENEVVLSSLYDYEAFNSPEKKKKDMSRVKEVKRNILGASSTPNKRKPLADISNSSGPQNAEDLTYFGFDDSSRISPRKHKRNDENSPENSPAKPSRFNVDKLRSYSKKQKKPLEQNIIENQNESVSLIEASTDESFGEVCLFEEPEEMLNKMSVVHVDLKKRRRKRLNSGNSDQEKRKKKYKKTKLEIEQEAWIKDFNEMCEEIDEHELEIE